MSDLFGSTASTATFSPCERYRYVLRREWDLSRSTLAFIGLNPSTADATQDDPTIRRCIRYARDMNFGGLVMLNLFGYRSTDPAGLYGVTDPVGPDNDRHIREEVGKAGLVIAAWGAHPAAQRMPGCAAGCDGSRAGHVRRIVDEYATLFALGVTKGGQPRHPLYLRADARPFALNQGETE